ncbi:MAG: anhydro-N-acetylmuramic acid kinase [Geminicoccaceae bacterium]
MAMAQWSRVIGLMSGTSMDGIDVAVIETDGERIGWSGPANTLPYAPALRARLDRAVRGTERSPAELADLERDLTDAHAAAVEAVLPALPQERRQVDLVGLHGHTLFHRPEQRRTCQLGDGQRLADRLGIDVVYDFRSADVAAGGQGAPLAPVYHQALAAALERPVAILNLGGVGNVTWIGDGAPIAFDTGPGNALLDDWVRARADRPYDVDGRIAAAGRIDEARLAVLLAHPYFEQAPPKSLDRLDFTLAPVEGLELEDGAATLAAFSARAVARAQAHLPAPPLRWLVTGGGRHNATLMAMLAEVLGVPVAPIETIGADGDALEAQAFAFLAVRSVRGLPISFPGTTGAPVPLCGGRLARAGEAAAPG